MTESVSEVEPKGSVGEDTSERHHAPHHLVCLVALRADCEAGQLRFGGDRRQNLATIVVEVDHVEHHFAGLLLVGHLCDQGQLFGLHRSVLTNCGTVCFPVLGLGIAAVKNTGDGAHGLRVVVHSLVLQI